MCYLRTKENIGRYRMSLINLLKTYLLTLLLFCLLNEFKIINCNEEPPQLPATYEQPFATILLSTVLHGKASLPCDITPSTYEDQVVLVLWYKDDELAPIYTLDARRGNMDRGRLLSSPFLEGRAYFNTHTRPAFLQIEPIESKDAGDYRCRVDFKKGRTVNTVIALKVIVPPKDPKIFDINDNELNGIVGPFNEGEELTLKCSTRGGKPRPSLSWWRDYAIIDDSFEFDDREVTTNQLTISPLSRHHLLSVLMCQAVNNNITTPSSTSITLDMNLKPTEVRITQLTPILVAQNEALFECNSYGSRPMPTIHWFFDGKRHDTRSHGEQQTSTTLTITVDRQHKGSILECVAQNPKIPNSGISDQIKLNVHYAPQLHLKLGTPTMSLDNIQEGIDIYFDCHIDANPRPTAPIVWIFNGNSLHPKQGIIESNQSLVLQHVNRWQSGTYQCQSSNQMGTALSNPIELRIRYAPVCSQPFTLVYGLSLHETVSIECEVEANPPQVSFQWKFESYTNLATFSQFNDSSSVLSYTPHASQEFGQIECIAKNSIGIQRQSCKYLITQSSEPSFPFSCSVVNQSDSTLSVNCIQINSRTLAQNTTGSVNQSVNYLLNKNIFQQTKQKSSKLLLDYKSGRTVQSNSDNPYLIVHPLTYYVCEVYTLSDMSLIKNVSIDAIKYRLMRQNSSFDFFIDELPAKTLLKLRIYALNIKNMKSPVQLDITTQTLIPAERLTDFIDFNAQNNTNYENSVRIQGKHLIIGVLISAAVVTLIVVILAIIAVFRVRYSTSSIHLTNDGLTEDNDRDVPQAETMLGNDCNDECSSGQTLLKCGNTSTESVDNLKTEQEYQKTNGSVGPPDIIPVPYFNANSCCDNELSVCNECNIKGSHSTCSQSHNCFIDATEAANYFTDYKMQDLYTKGGRVYVYNKEDNTSNQLTDYQNVLHVNLIPGNSKQQQQSCANVSL